MICPSTQRLWVAYSGGLDSHVLLHGLAQLRNDMVTQPDNSTLGQFELRAVHIHHGLHLQADQWANHCQQICAMLAIPCHVIPIQVQVKPRESLEANARTARYEAIAQLLSSDEVVLTAQHADDQAETLLLQLLRGSGIAGLAAMPTISRLGKGWLGRPLLAYTRTELLAYAQQARLQWIEDSSNTDTRFDRNFLRHEIMPRLQQRWSSLSHILSRAARHQAEASELIQSVAIADWHRCQGPHLEQLSWPTLLQLDPIRQRHVIRFWLKKCQLPMPSTVQLQHIMNDLLTAGADRQPVVRWQGGEIRRYRDHLFAMANLPPVPTQLSSITWSLPHPPTLPLGWLTVREVSGQGLALPIGTPLQVRFRQGGETFRWHGHQRRVKKLLQTAQLLPWQRPFMPLIYWQDTLVIIPNLGIKDGWVASAKTTGWKIQWHLHSTRP